jgi:hypothetical protein
MGDSPETHGRLTGDNFATPGGVETPAENSEELELGP